MLNKEKLWVEKYRPQTLNEICLPENYKKVFQTMVDSGDMPNLLFFGKAGVGKTTLAKILCKELDFEVLFINGSNERNIDTLRNEVEKFVSTMSLSGKRKCVIFDEADGLNGLVQNALKAFIEKFADVRFIFTSNHQNKIIKPIHSRCKPFNFTNMTSENPLGSYTAATARIEHILKSEGIEYDLDSVKRVVVDYYPDMRALTMELKGSVIDYVDNGVTKKKIDTSAMAKQDVNIKGLTDILKSKNYTQIRKWVADSKIEPDELFSTLYNSIGTELPTESFPQLTLILAEYQYKSSMVVDQDINTAACLLEMTKYVK